MPRSWSQCLQCSNLCINLDLYLLSDSYSVWLQQPSLQRLVFFRLAYTFVLTGPQLLNDGHLSSILGVTQGDPPPATWMLCLYLRSTFSMFSCSEISMAGVNLEHKLKMSDERSSQYECLWSTNGMNESKSKDRFYSVLYIKFTKDKQLNARVQCKMYSLKDKNHVTWGTCLKNLHIDCKMKDGQNYIDVQQVLFK